MNRIHSNSDSTAGVNALLHYPSDNVGGVSSGALGKHQQRVDFAFGSNGNAACSVTKISLQEANNALKKLLDAVPGNHKSPSLPDFMQMDPSILSAMVTTLILKAFGSNAQSLCQQIERATDLQNALRDKQLKEYQDAIQKAIEQADKARKAGIFSALFDWITGIVETVLGALKVAEGFLSGNPTEMASGIAYMLAGCAGMIKAGAETAMLFGADHDTCQSIINVTSKIQLGCEVVALALDVFQIGRAFMATRGLSGAAAKVLDSGFGEEIAERMANTGVEEIEEEINALAKEFGQQVSDEFVKQFESLEREMVLPGEMAEESAQFSREIETKMTQSAGKSFTKEGVQEIAEEAIKEALKKCAQAGKKLLLKELRDEILSKMFKKILSALMRDSACNRLQYVRTATEAGNQINNGVITVVKAKLEKKIEQLMNEQWLLSFIMEQAGDQKKVEQKRLQELYKGCGVALKNALDTIDQCGSVQAKMAGWSA